MIKQGDKHCTKPVFKLRVPDDQYKVQPLPQPTGEWPYRMDVANGAQKDSYSKMVFHMVGDTGSAKQPSFQQKVAAEMVRQFNVDDASDRPLFLIHLGDVVYHFGEAEEYYRQFFEPYKNYPAPIFAIAGNHDADVNPAARKPYKSLEAFVTVFCDTQAREIMLAQDTGRTSATQPNVYYTLQTPLATFICLYSNVPKFGFIDEEQKRWFVAELKAAGLQQKAIIVCIHHAPYSADANHGSSQPMIQFLETAYDTAGVRPHIVFSGHVHNYQRFSKQYADGVTTPYVVAGAGGYVTLFPVVKADGINYVDDHPLLAGVCLESYCDYRHGFLKVSIEKQRSALLLEVEYYTIPPTAAMEGEAAVLFDKFTINIGRGWKH